MMYEPTPLEAERKRRINVLLWAYAYEFKNHSIVDDFKFDEVCRQIDPSFSTGHKVMDKFFREEFDPSTGQWVHDVPKREKVKLANLYYRTFEARKA